MKISFNDIQLPSNKRFGFFFTIVFLLTSVYFYIEFYKIAFYCFCFLTIVFFFITIFKAEILRPLNRLWMSLGLILGVIISPIIMGMIFFIIFTPVGILMRLFGRDELGLKLKKKSSYWIKREDSNQSNSFKYQF